VIRRGWSGRAPRLARVALVLALAVGPASAHVFEITDASVLLKMRGAYEIDVTVDADALALGVSPLTDSAQNVAALLAMTPAQFEAALDRARDTVLRRIRIRFDDVKVQPWVTFPELDTPLADEASTPTVLGTVVRFSGRIPAGAAELTLGLSRSFGPVRLTVFEEETARGARYMLGAGEDSPQYRLGKVPPASRPGLVALDYLVLGFEHIVPLGADHILFVLGLFLLSPRLRPLLWQVTAFTLAHSLTLGLSMAGAVELPSRLVEPLIALSIAYVGVENLWTSELRPWRPVLVFAFGLLHGLGFAGALRELGLPEGEFAIGLIAFNVGVELGQLGVILLALAVFGWFRGRPWYRPWVVWPLSVAIAVVGLYWTVERAL